ncbi:MAG: hypothetical protein O7J95_20560 [Planctomycetota bacterium]|nr:hypothetical protein [Planctomycetota bacterium]
MNRRRKKMKKTKEKAARRERGRPADASSRAERAYRSLVPAPGRGPRAASPSQRGPSQRGPGQRGAGVVRATTACGYWQRFVASDLRVAGGRTAPVPAFLDEAVAPRGPFKLLPGDSEERVVLVADLPLEPDADCRRAVRTEALPVDFLTRGEEPAASTDLAAELDSRASRRDGDLDLWSGDFRTAVAALGGPAYAGSIPARLPPPDREALAERLVNRGWRCSRKNDEIFVNFESRHFFKQVHVRLEGDGDVSCDMELADASDWPPASLEAAAVLARRAGEVLRLVRLVYRAEAPARGHLLAQVHLGSLSSESEWLSSALDSLHAAAVLLACEVPALADPELCRLILQSSC